MRYPMSEGWLRQILTVSGDTRGGFASAGGIEQILGLDGELDERVEARVGGEVEDGLCLLLAQNQGRGVRLLQTLEAMPEQLASG